MKNSQQLTKPIRNLGNMLILKFLALNKNYGKLKIIVSKSQTTHSQTVAFIGITEIIKENKLKWQKQ